jgi:two-component system alkaline phosphatase synthesis response regulator PhoP
VVYYVEDDASVRELTLYALAQAGIEAEGFADDAAFRLACARRTPDAVLLDMMLPGASGMEILARMKADGALKRVPVMMVTARDAEFDVVRALDAGADDYVTKPFGMMELVSRVRALLRRGAMGRPRRPDAVVAGGIVYDEGARTVAVDGREVELTQREFDLLGHFVKHEGVVSSRETLLQDVWGWDFDGGTRTVDVHVQQLRAKLGDAGRRIETVRGVGYRFRGDE